MVMTSVHCRILGDHVTCMTDLEGHVTRINCPEYVQSNGTCRLKAPEFQAGPLSRLLVQAAGQDLGARDALCDLGAA